MTEKPTIKIEFVLKPVFGGKSYETTQDAQEAAILKIIDSSNTDALDWIKGVVTHAAEVITILQLSEPPKPKRIGRPKGAKSKPKPGADNPELPIPRSDGSVKGQAKLTPELPMTGKENKA